MKALVFFFVATFLFAWTFWFAAAQVSSAPLFLLGTFAPGIVTIAMTFRNEGREGVAALLSRLFQVQSGAGWFVFALTFMMAVKLTAALIHRIAAGVWPRFGDDPWYLLIAAAIASTLLLGQAGEEIGWRGFALPRMAERMGLARASVLLGVIWAVWHLPLFFIAATSTTGQSFPLYLLQVTALSVIIAWLYANTGPGLWPVMLLHAAVNNTKDIVPSAVEGATNAFALSTSPIAWITVALLWTFAAYCLFRMSAMRWPTTDSAERPG